MLLQDLSVPVVEMKECLVALTAVHTSRSWDMANKAMENMTAAMENYDLGCQHIRIHARPPKAKAASKGKAKAKAKR